MGNAAFGSQPVGTGPFRFTERKPREYIKFSAFDKHWGHVPKIGEVTLRIVADDQTRMAQIQTGEADIVTSVPLIFAARMRSPRGFQITRVPGFGNAFVVINNRGDNPDLKKAEVRRALNMAVNRPALAKAITFGFATMHESPCTPGMIGCDTKFDDPYTYDPVAAKKLLTAAGFNFDRPLKIVGAATGRVLQSKETVESLAQFTRYGGHLRRRSKFLEYGTWSSVAFAKSKDPFHRPLSASRPGQQPGCGPSPD